jgi:flagellin
MGLSSINTNIAAYYAQSNISKASNNASSAIARLSSGNRIVRASDDVAAMSAGTSLRTNVTTLKMALVNTSQGSSLLQVADGALSQVTDILQRQKAIAVQSGSGSLSDNERSFLNQEFTNLASEIDRIVENTNFNGVTLLDGSLSEKVDVKDSSAVASKASASINFSILPADGDKMTINGVVLTILDTLTGAAATATAMEVQRGPTIQTTIDNLVTALNASTNTALSSVTYSRSGSSLVLTSDKAGSQGNNIRINSSTAANNTAIDGTNGAATISGAGGASTVTNLFNANTIAVASITDTIVANGAATATQQIANNSVLSVNIGGAGAVAIYTAATSSPTGGASLEDVVNTINAGTATHGVTARIVGYSGAYNIQVEHFDVTNDVAATTSTLVPTITNTSGTLAVNAAAANTVNIFTLSGGTDAGLSAGDVVGRGTMGNDILTSQNQQKASVSVIFPSIADDQLSASTNFGGTTPSGITIGTGTGAVTFRFTADGSSDLEAQIGSTLTETLDNMVSKINSYYGSAQNNYMMNQVEARRDGNNIVMESVDYANPAGNYATAVTLTVATTSPVTGSSVTNTGNLSNAQNDGVSTGGVTNKDFIGKISGFKATYTGTADSVDISVTVGDHTYTATSVDTTPATDTTVRFSSQTGGGYFDVEMQGNKGQAVSSQAGANDVATRLDAAFASLNFFQNRDVSSYTGNAPILTDGVVSGTLIGTSVQLQNSSFDKVSIDSIRVTAPSGSNPNGKIVLTVNGEEYTSASNVGNQLGANTKIKLVSATDSDKFITFNTGDTAIEFDTAAKAASFQTALESAFGVGNGSAELKFQVGVTTEDTLSVSVGNITTNKLYNGAKLDVLTAASAATASDAIDSALDKVTSARAEIGAMMSRFDFAAANVESSLQNQDAARGVLLDTDVASESTRFSTAQVQLQAGIAVLAQANQLPQNLLKLIS